MSKVYAVRVHQLGGPEVLRYEQVEVGKPELAPEQFRRVNRAHNQIDAIRLHATVEERPSPRVRCHAGAELKIHLVPPLK